MGVDFYIHSEENFLYNASIEDLPFEEWQKLRKEPEFYVRESYHGVTHAVSEFCPESYESIDSTDPIGKSGGVVLDWKECVERLPAVAQACLQREIDYLSKQGELVDRLVMEDQELTEYGMSQLKIFCDITRFVVEEHKAGRRVIARNSY